MLVLKFGGTSVGSPAAIENIIRILNDTEHRGRVAAVVVSAFSGLTDALIATARQAARLVVTGLAASGPSTANPVSWEALAGDLRKRHRDMAACFLEGEALGIAHAELDGTLEELIRILKGIEALGEISPSIQDRVMSFGERLSAALLARIFRARGIEASFLDMRPLIKTDSAYGRAAFIPAETYANIRRFFDGAAGIPVCTGFIASDTSGHTTTLGRGGSDLSAPSSPPPLGRTSWRYGPMWTVSLPRTPGW